LCTALVYTRVSSDEQQRDGISLDVQLGDCRRYAAERAWLLDREYQDVLSGTRDDRPQYQALLDAARHLRAAGQEVVVVVWRLDRFGRRVLERVRCREELKQLGVAVHSVREGGEVSDLVANILASVAEEEVRQISERVSAAKQHVMATGWHPGGRPTWGFANRLATAEERAQGAPQCVLALDESTAPYARELFERVAAGTSVRQASLWAAQLPAPLRADRTLAHSAIRLMLRSPTYIARIRRDGPPCHWPALVDLDTWDRVQTYLEDHRILAHQASRRYLLTGFIRCPQCGRRPRGGQSGGRSRGYGCRGTPAAWCGYTVRPAEAIEQPVLTSVATLLDQIVGTAPGLSRELQRRWDALRHPPDTSPTQAQQERLARVMAQARQRLTRAAVLFADGDIDKAGYELLRDQARADLDAATAEAERLSPAAPPLALPPLATVLHELGRWGTVLAAADVGAQRDVLHALVAHVTPCRAGRGRYRAEITWTPLGLALHALAAAPAAAS
jgi:DNA invertase Pin-like site-specific DNA recombinase